MRWATARRLTATPPAPRSQSSQLRCQRHNGRSGNWKTATALRQRATMRSRREPSSYDQQIGHRARLRSHQQQPPHLMRHSTHRYHRRRCRQTRRRQRFSMPQRLPAFGRSGQRVTLLRACTHWTARCATFSSLQTLRMRQQVATVQRSAELGRWRRTRAATMAPQATHNRCKHGSTDCSLTHLGVASGGDDSYHRLNPTTPVKTHARHS